MCKYKTWYTRQAPYTSMDATLKIFIIYYKVIDTRIQDDKVNTLRL